MKTWYSMSCKLGSRAPGIVGIYLPATLMKWALAWQFSRIAFMSYRSSFYIETRPLHTRIRYAEVQNIISRKTWIELCTPFTVQKLIRYRQIQIFRQIA